MRGRAAAALSWLTVTRTSSEPARARDITWLTVPDESAVSVLVIDCTTIGRSPPTGTPPTSQTTLFLRVTDIVLDTPARVQRTLIVSEQPEPFAAAMRREPKAWPLCQRATVGGFVGILIGCNWRAFAKGGVHRLSSGRCLRALVGLFAVR